MLLKLLQHIAGWVNSANALQQSFWAKIPSSKRQQVQLCYKAPNDFAWKCFGLRPKAMWHKCQAWYMLSPLEKQVCRCQQWHHLSTNSTFQSRYLRESKCFRAGCCCQWYANMSQFRETGVYKCSSIDEETSKQMARKPITWICSDPTLLPTYSTYPVEGL